MNHSDLDWLEIVRHDHPTGPFAAAVFDFDGTISLLRRNWQDTMIPMFVEILDEQTETQETDEQLHELVETFVMRLNGKQTIYQMMQLCEEVRQRGGTPKDPLEYKHEYHDRLWQQVGRRVEAVRSGETSATMVSVPGIGDLLDALASAGTKMYLASGTDLKYVRDELALLGLDSFFGSRVYGALDDYQNFSKAMVMRQILSDCGIEGHQLVAFGDGYVEIQEMSSVGGLAIGVASNEESREGINAWKRQRLIDAGAHWIIGDYRHHAELVRLVVRG